MLLNPLTIVQRALESGTLDVEGFEEAYKVVMSAMEVREHCCSDMPEDIKLASVRHPEIRNGEWSPWNWEQEDCYKDISVYFCVYCMEDSKDF